MTAIIVVVVLGAMSTAAWGGANHWYVDPDGNNLSDGNSWDEAFATIQKGIDKAGKGDLVKVKAGTYYETIDFKGKAITVRGTDPNSWVVVTATIIDANGSGNVVTFNSSEDGNSVLEGFTIRNGDRGIYCKKASPTIWNCFITGNKSSKSGGGMFNDRSSSAPIVINCVFAKNKAAGHGGGMANWNGARTMVINCVFWNNKANKGGGMVNEDQRTGKGAEIINCTFFQNNAEKSGGGVYNEEAYPTFTNCIFWGNVAGDKGGEIYNRGSKPLFNHCTVEGGLNEVKCGGQKSKDGDDNEEEDPGFVNGGDPDGKDNTWGTSDDGLIPTGKDVVNGGYDKIVKDRRITIDIKGDDRIIGRHVDMGAYESKSKPKSKPRSKYKRKPRSRPKPKPRY
jgi:hypothetical protein